MSASGHGDDFTPVGGGTGPEEPALDRSATEQNLDRLRVGRHRDVTLEDHLLAHDVWADPLDHLEAVRARAVVGEHKLALHLRILPTPD